VTVILDPAARRAMELHTTETYPEEACGFLLGTEGEPRRLVQARPTANVHGEDKTRRFTIDPREILRLDRELEGGPVKLLGFYHSHPDHPAVPSTYDTERGWSWYSYLIQALRGGKLGDLRAWRLEEGAGLFKEEDLIIRSASVEAR
jgi:proteasome lid subunit RPN8/RPN11